MNIRAGNPHEPAATQLLHDSHKVMTDLFPPESNNYLSIDSLCQPGIHFFVAEVDGVTKGCGALAERDGYAELKSMFVASEARGQGIADALLDHLEATARSLDVPVVRLETGTLLHAALNLYSRHGYKFRARFGDYVETPYSLYMEKKL